MDLKFKQKKLRLLTSDIHGYGLFADERIKRGEPVIEYTGERITQEVADMREKRKDSNGRRASYFFRCNDGSIIDGTNGNLARFINHSCNANCYSEEIEDDRSSNIIIFSKRPIPKGEEITIDYHFVSTVDEYCNCGSPKCRSVLNEEKL